MRINKIVYLFAILSAGLTLTSCLGEPEEVEPTAKTLITSCSLNSNITAYTSNMVKNSKGEMVEVKDTTVYASSDYPLTIDQISNVIYNRDSLPVGSDLRKMPITLNSAGAYATRLIKDKDGNEVDTVWSSTDSLDLTKPVKLKVYAGDLVTTRVYTIKINVHTVDPDSLVWNKFSNSFSGGAVTGSQRALIHGDKIIVYADVNSQPVAYVNTWASPSAEWTKTELVNAQNADILSAYVYGGNVLMRTNDGKMLKSADGINWEAAGLEGNVSAIVGEITYEGHNRLIAISDVDGKKVFRVSEDGQNWLDNTAPVPAGFPETNFKGFQKKLSTTSKYYRLNVMGRESETAALNDTISYAWFTNDGLDWAEMETVSIYHMPKMINPTYIYYNDLTMAFGYGPEEKFNNMYVSEEYGLVWKPREKKLRLSYDFEGRMEYSAVVAPDNYIWIFWSKGSNCNDEVWRGRVNKLGFKTK